METIVEILYNNYISILRITGCNFCNISRNQSEEGEYFMAENISVERIQALKRILDGSTYTVAICGSGMMEEGGTLGIKKPDRAYEIEKKYGASPEYIYSSVYYNTRAEQFFQFYREELLKNRPLVTESGRALAAMEKAGKLQCIVSGNIYNLSKISGCKNVINLHGNIYDNHCPRCKKQYSLEYMLNAKKVPICETCNVPIRPGVSLFGEMVDSQLMTKTTEEVEKADVLMLLGTTLESETFKNYVRYFSGSHLVIIHQNRHYTDDKADFVIIDHPKNVLPLLKY